MSAWRRVTPLFCSLGLLCLAPAGAASAPAAHVSTVVQQTLLTKAKAKKATRAVKRRATAKRTRRAAPKKAPPRAKTKQLAPEPERAADTGGADEAAPIRRGERVEFDGRLIQGQTAKAGSVYLFERKSSELKSMVKERESYREEILQLVYPKRDHR